MKKADTEWSNWSRPPRTKKEVVRRMLSIADNLDKLQEGEFDIEDYVSDHENECGTVCCTIGWFPKWYPEGPFSWLKNRPGHLTIVAHDQHPLVDTAAMYVGISRALCISLTIPRTGDRPRHGHAPFSELESCRTYHSDDLKNAHLAAKKWREAAAKVRKTPLSANSSFAANIKK